MSDDLAKHAAVEFVAAVRALDDAELLLREGRIESSISRAYYAVFHAARAALNLENSAPTTHRGVKSEFGRLLVKPGKIEPAYNAILQEARDQRTVADYEPAESDLLVTPDLAKDIVAKARQFVERIRTMLDEEP